MRQPIKFNTYMKGRLGWQNLRADEYTEDGPLLVSSEHFYDDRIAWEECNHASQERYEIAPEIQLRPHDVLFMKDGAAMGKLAYVDELPAPACINSHLLLMRPQYSSYVPRFLFYVLKSHMFQAYMITRRTGTTFFGFSQESMGEFPLSFPSVKEQFQIVDFLDRETTQIDALIAKQKRLIAVLQEKRQALISHAVTKGLNPDAPMKDSGVEWLGEVPAHWELVRVGHISRGPWPNASTCGRP